MARTIDFNGKAYHIVISGKRVYTKRLPSVLIAHFIGLGYAVIIK